jgi:hypothetical protein
MPDDMKCYWHDCAEAGTLLVWFHPEAPRMGYTHKVIYCESHGVTICAKLPEAVICGRVR